MNRFVLALASLISLPLCAAPLAHLSVTPAQRAALGIQTAAPAPVDRYPTAALAARVVAARGMQWQLATPLAGQVRRVQPVGTVLAVGDVVAVIASAQLLELAAEQVEARNLLEQAIADRIRAVALYEDGSVARKERDQALRNERLAQARNAALRSRFQLLGIEPEQAASGELPITAPVAGRVSAVHALTGSRAEASMPVAEILNPDALELELQWPLSRGAVPVQGARFVTASGAVSQVIAEAPASASTRQSVLLRLGLVDTAPQLRPGQWLWVHPQIPTPALAVDRNAVIRNAGQAVVFTDTGDGFAVTAVTIEGEQAGTRYVRGEIPAGARVAVSGAIALKGLWLGHGGE